VRHNYRETMRAGRKPGASAIDPGTVKTVVHIVRRLGVVLNRALDVAITQLLAQEMLATAEALRDDLKPLCDALIHFEAAELEEPSDGV